MIRMRVRRMTEEDPEVHSPSHYTQASMETIDVIENSIPHEHFLWIFTWQHFKIHVKI